MLEVYERTYDPKQPVICLEEKPVTLHAGLRPASRVHRGERRDGLAKTGRHFTFITPDRSALNSRG